MVCPFGFVSLFCYPGRTMGETYRSRGSELLGKGSPRGNGGERAGGAAIVGERLHVHSGATVVIDDGVLGRGQAEDGTECDQRGLHG